MHLALRKEGDVNERSHRLGTERSFFEKMVFSWLQRLWGKLQNWESRNINYFQDHRWAWNSCRKPYFLWEKYPNLLHVEPKTFLPSWDKWEVKNTIIFNKLNQQKNLAWFGRNASLVIFWKSKLNCVLENSVCCAHMFR